ncbi:MAG: nuclear transport factor 2 family protein [Pseudomonadota bacterium]|nr:nuclear transport factor 2 family protein [Pseudomonadota bacterium]
MEQDLLRRIAALEDVEAIRTLKARYLFCCDRKDVDGMRGCFVDGAAHIDYGAIGRFDNADALVAVFRELGCHEHMVEMHHGVNPQIRVLGDTAAAGTWGLHYFLIDTQAQRCTQLAGYYEDEYRKEGGAWKISATRFVVSSTLVLDLSESLARCAFAGRALPMAA